MITERGKRYGVRVHLGGGRYEWRGTFDTATEAQQAQAGTLQTPLTVAQWTERWLVLYPRAGVSTRRSYAEAVRRVNGLLGDREMRQVSRAHVREILPELARCHVPVARACWADAQRDGIVEQNPWSDLRLPRSRGRADIQALSNVEVDRLCAIARAVHAGYGPEMAAIIQTLAYSGMRPGELMALRAQDVNGALQVRQTRRVDGSEGPPKNGRARTVVRADAVQPRHDDGYAFRSPSGRPLTRSSLHRAWRRVLRQWRQEGGRDLDLYELRHAFASRLIDAGVPAHAVALQMGHSDGGRLVQSTYGHPDEERSRELVRAAIRA